VGVRGKHPGSEKLEKNYLVKYCNFIVNLGHSVGGIFDNRSYVNLGIFFPRRQFLVYMRELYHDCVLICVQIKEERLCKSEEEITTNLL